MVQLEEMWKNPLIHSNINVGFRIVTCVLINYSKCKMKLLYNGFNMLKIDGSIHVPCGDNWKNVKKSLTHYNAFCK
jgi:hypothetical protein